VAEVVKRVIDYEIFSILLLNERHQEQCVQVERVLRTSATSMRRDSTSTRCGEAEVTIRFIRYDNSRLKDLNVCGGKPL
jgi:hypothetical protein